MKAREVQKGYYDPKCRLRRFAVGDKCLVLLPTVSNKLLAQWNGSYEVQEIFNDLNYVLLFEGQPKRFHVNMLKHYYEAETAAGCERVTNSTEYFSVRELFEKPQGKKFWSDEQRRCQQIVRDHFADLYRVHKRVKRT